MSTSVTHCEACGKHTQVLTRTKPCICRSCFELGHMHRNQGDTADPEWIEREWVRKTTERKRFPLQHGVTIPWSMAERAYAVYAKGGHNQSLERLAERGGFGVQEWAVMVCGVDPYKCNWEHLRPKLDDYLGKAIALLVVAELEEGKAP